MKYLLNPERTHRPRAAGTLTPFMQGGSVFRRVLRVSSCALALSWLGACGTKATGNTGSETHWLSVCHDDSECNQGSCWCGVCTKGCSGSEACDFDDGPAALCGSSGLLATCESSAPAQLCLAADVVETQNNAARDGGIDAASNSGDGNTGDGNGSAGNGSTGSSSAGEGGSANGGSVNGSVNGGSDGEPDDTTTRDEPPGAICDGSDDVRFVSIAAGGLNDQYYIFIGAYGDNFLAIDGHCHYWAGAYYDGKVREGTLSETEAEMLAPQLSYGELDTYQGYESPICLDAAPTTLWDTASSVRCACDCGSDDAPEGWAMAFTTARALRTRLFESGAASQAPIRVLGVVVSDGILDDFRVAWPLTSSPPLSAPGTLSRDSGQLFEAAGDLKALRAARAEFDASDVAQRGILSYVNFSYVDSDSETGLYQGYLRDELPAYVLAALDNTRSGMPASAAGPTDTAPDDGSGEVTVTPADSGEQGKPSEEYSFEPWGSCVIPESPGEPVSELATPGTGACDGQTLESVLVATYEAFPELADIVLIVDSSFEGEEPDVNSSFEGEQPDGRAIYALQGAEGGFSLVFERGNGDCGSGSCIDHEWTYIATDAACEPRSVGYHSNIHDNESGCIERTGLPLWGIPRPRGSSDTCSLGTPRDFAGLHSIPFYGERTPCATRGQDASQLAISGTLDVLFTQDAGDPTRGTAQITSDDFDYAWLESQAFDVTLEGDRARISLQWDNTPTMCLESNDLSVYLDFEGCYESVLSLQEVYDVGCDEGREETCKGSLTLSLDLSAAMSP